MDIAEPFGNTFWLKKRLVDVAIMSSACQSAREAIHHHPCWFAQLLGFITENRADTPGHRHLFGYNSLSDSLFLSDLDTFWKPNLPTPSF